MADPRPADCTSDAIYIENLTIGPTSCLQDLQQTYDCSTDGDRTIIVTGDADDGVNIRDTGVASSPLFNVQNNTGGAITNDRFQIQNSGNTVISDDLNTAAVSLPNPLPVSNSLIVDANGGEYLVGDDATNTGFPQQTTFTAPTRPNHSRFVYDADTTSGGGVANIPIAISVAGTDERVYGILVHAIGSEPTGVPAGGVGTRQNVWHEARSIGSYDQDIAPIVVPITTTVGTLGGLTTLTLVYNAPNYEVEITNNSGVDLTWRIYVQLIENQFA